MSNWQLWSSKPFCLKIKTFYNSNLTHNQTSNHFAIRGKSIMSKKSIAKKKCFEAWIFESILEFKRSLKLLSAYTHSLNHIWAIIPIQTCNCRKHLGKKVCVHPKLYKFVDPLEVDCKLLEALGYKAWIIESSSLVCLDAWM